MARIYRIMYTINKPKAKWTRVDKILNKLGNKPYLVLTKTFKNVKDAQMFRKKRGKSVISINF